MQQPRTTSASTPSSQSRENDALVEVERILDQRPPAPTLPFVRERAPVFRRIAPLVLLAGVGAALALMPAELKDALRTGRSIAQSSDR